MKKNIVIGLVLFVLLSLIAPIRLNTITPPQCGYNGGQNDGATCISSCTICNTNPIGKTSSYPSIAGYVIYIKDRNSPYPPVVYTLDIARNEIVIAILATGFFFVISKTKRTKNR